MTIEYANKGLNVQMWYKYKSDKQMCLFLNCQ